MNLKFSLCFIFLSLLTHNQVSAATNEKSLSHNITWGAHSQRDVHISKQIITAKFKPMRIVKGDYIYRPKPGDLHYGQTITQIDVIDQYTNGNGGYATLKDGGPGTNFVVIHLKSQRNHGYNFIIEIYGQ